MKVLLDIENGESLPFQLSTEKTAKTIINKIINNKEKNINFSLSRDYSFLEDYWFNFLLDCGFELDILEDSIECNNSDQSNAQFVLCVISLLHLYYARKTIIANTIFLTENFKEASKATIYLVALHASKKPRYSKMFPLVKPFNFAKNIRRYKQINTIFKQQEYNVNLLVNAVNIKNLKIIKNYLNE